MGRGCVAMGGSAGSSSVHASKRLRQLTQPASPRPKTAAPTRHRRGDVHLLTPVASPSSGEGSEKGHVDAVTAAALETASTPAASSQQRRRAGSLDQPHEACTVAGAGSSPKLAAREAPGGRLCGGSGRPTDPHHYPKESCAYPLKTNKEVPCGQTGLPSDKKDIG